MERLLLYGKRRAQTKLNTAERSSKQEDEWKGKEATSMDIGFSINPRN